MTDQLSCYGGTPCCSDASSCSNASCCSDSSCCSGTPRGCHQITGLILAGGQARRMQLPGRPLVDKGLVEIGGEPLVARMRRYLEPRVTQVWVNANRELDVYARYGRVLVDDPALGENLGPLAGVASALAQIETPWLVVAPVDVVLLPDDLIERLAKAVLEAQAPIAYACAGGPQPLCMLLHRDRYSSLCDFLRMGGRKVQQWQQLNQAVAVEFSPDANVFFNVNTRDDLCAAQQLLSATKT